MRPMPFLLGAPFTCARFVQEISGQTLDATTSPPITCEPLSNRTDRSSGPYRGSRESPIMAVPWSWPATVVSFGGQSQEQRWLHRVTQELLEFSGRSDVEGERWWERNGRETVRKPSLS